MFAYSPKYHFIQFVAVKIGLIIIIIIIITVSVDVIHIVLVGKNNNNIIIMFRMIVYYTLSDYQYLAKLTRNHDVFFIKCTIAKVAKFTLYIKTKRLHFL